MRRVSVIGTYLAIVDDVEAPSLVHECRELEEKYQSDFTIQILEAAEHLDSACVLREAETKFNRQ